MTMENSPFRTAGTRPGQEDRLIGVSGGSRVQMPARHAFAGNVMAMEAGAGITGGTGTVYKSGVRHDGGIYHTRILIDITGLSSNVLGDIIGKAATANCHLGQITAAVNGTIFAGMMSCHEAPATGEPDIDLYSAEEATGTEDAAISDLTETALLAAGADWTAANGTMNKKLTAWPAANEYLYLVGGGGTTDAVYTAGRFVIDLWGY